MKTGLFEKTLQAGEIWKRRLFVLVTENILKTELFENDGVTVIIFTITAEIHARSLINFYCQYAERHMNFIWNSCDASGSESGKFDNLLNGFPDRVSLKHTSKITSDYCVFKFLRQSVDEKYLIRFQSETSFFNFCYTKDSLLEKIRCCRHTQLTN